MLIFFLISSATESVNTVAISLHKRADFNLLSSVLLLLFVVTCCSDFSYFRCVVGEFSAQISQ